MKNLILIFGLFISTGLSAQTYNLDSLSIINNENQKIYYFHNGIDSLLTIDSTLQIIPTANKYDIEIKNNYIHAVSKVRS